MRVKESFNNLDMSCKTCNLYTAVTQQIFPTNEKICLVKQMWSCWYDSLINLYVSMGAGQCIRVYSYNKHSSIVKLFIKTKARKAIKKHIESLSMLIPPLTPPPYFFITLIAIGYFFVCAFSSLITHLLNYDSVCYAGSANKVN